MIKIGCNHLFKNILSGLNLVECACSHLVFFFEFSEMQICVKDIVINTVFDQLEI